MADTVSKSRKGGSAGDVSSAERSSNRNSIFVGVFFLLSFFAAVVLIYQGPEAVRSGGAAVPSSKAGIAVVDINGVIQFAAQGGFFGGSQGAAGVVAQIRRYIKNKQVKGLILRINSPGGAIGATQEIYNAVKDFKKSGRPVIASMADVAASGGYYVACAADEIYANGGTVTGSIGVIMSAPDMKGLYDWIKIRWNVIKSGRFKDILSPYRHMRADERRLLTDMVRNAYQQFFNTVLVARRVRKNKLAILAQGQVFSGQQAKKTGLVDTVGDFEAALLRAGKLAGIKGRPFVIRPRRVGLLGSLQRLLGKLSQASSNTPFSMVTGRGSRLPVICYLYRGL